ncbi:MULTISPECIES: hypothetical protein [unclassified Paraburkholderia]|uniref:hypothetical protein n=1 Tax=unclassified Paraburkholderia TaxID=2615204 RepID=UPI002AB111E5|nr:MULTISPECIES: hypothetical protein [unclassified Paraburkholderia]
MKKSLYLMFICGVLIASVSIIAQYRNSSSTHNAHADINSPSTVLRLGEPLASDFDAPGASIDKHPTGAEFYQHEWVRGNLGVVQITDGKFGFPIDNVLSAIGMADKEVPGGIYEWSINVGVSPEQADTPQAALNRMFKLLSLIRGRGWTRYISVDDPRLTGKEAWVYAKDNSEYSLDSTYTPNLDEWKSMTKAMPQWVFQADGNYLKVSIFESNMGGFADKATYLITVSLKNEYAFYGLGFFPRDVKKIDNWKVLLPAELNKYHADRLKTEVALKAHDYTIDTAYQDPAIKALQQSADKPH